MILIGELETTNKMIFPDGNTGFLFVGTSVDDTTKDNLRTIYYYAISPYELKNSWNVGDFFSTRENLSVTEFLQRVVDMDIEIGRNVIMRLGDNVKIRLKGMTEWIERSTAPLENHRMVFPEAYS
jgi:hypothetical protein